MKLIALLLILCVSCCSGLEYRKTWGKEYERYYGWSNSKQHLDPKIGPRAKLYLIDEGTVRPYVGGHFRRRRLQLGAGVVYYPNDHVGLEFGYRRRIFTYNRYRDRIRTVDNFEDAKDMFFIGGVIRF